MTKANAALPRYPASAASVIDFLSGKCPALTPEELGWLQSATLTATTMASQWSQVLVGLGCLIGEDASEPGSAGNFQNHDDLPDLLFTIADQLATIAALNKIGRAAAQSLGEKQGGCHA